MSPGRETLNDPPSPVPSSSLGISPLILQASTFSRFPEGPPSTYKQPHNKPFATSSLTGSYSLSSLDQHYPPTPPTSTPLPSTRTVTSTHVPLSPDGYKSVFGHSPSKDESSSATARDSTSSALYSVNSFEDGHFPLSAIGRAFPHPPTELGHAEAHGLGLRAGADDDVVGSEYEETEEDKEERKKMEMLRKLSQAREAAAQTGRGASYFEKYGGKKEEPRAGMSAYPPPLPVASSWSSPLPSLSSSASTLQQSNNSYNSSPSRSSFVSTSTLTPRVNNPFISPSSANHVPPTAASSSTVSTPNSASFSYPAPTPILSNLRRLHGTEPFPRASDAASVKTREQGRHRHLSSLQSNTSSPQAPYPSGPLPSPPSPSTSFHQPFPTPPSQQDLPLPDTPGRETFRTTSTVSTGGGGALLSSGGSVHSQASSAVIVNVTRGSATMAVSTPSILAFSEMGARTPSGRWIDHERPQNGEEELVDGSTMAGNRASALEALEGRGTPSPVSASSPSLAVRSSPRKSSTIYPPPPSPAHLLTPIQQETVDRLRNSSPSKKTPSHSPSPAPLAFLAGPSNYPFPFISSSSNSASGSQDGGNSNKRNSETPSNRSSRFPPSASRSSNSHKYASSLRPSSLSSNVSLNPVAGAPPHGVKRTPSRIKRWEAGLSLAKLVRRADRVHEILKGGGTATGSDVGGAKGYVHHQGRKGAISAGAGASKSKGGGSLRSWVSGGGGGGTSSRRSTGRAGVGGGSSEIGGDGEFTELGDNDHVDERGVVIIGPESSSKEKPPAVVAVPEKAMRRRSVGKRLSALGGRWAGGRVVDEEREGGGSGTGREMVEKEIGVVMIGFGKEDPTEVTGVEYMPRDASYSSQWERKPLPAPPTSEGMVWMRRKKLVAYAVGLLLLILVIALPVALLTGHKDDSVTSSTPSASPNGTACAGGKVGSFCNLDASCVCTSNSIDCQPLASSLVALAETASTIFNTSLSAFSLATFLNTVQPRLNASDCNSQALLFDLGSSLDPSTQPRRVEFAQSALLWQLVKTESLAIVEGLRSFVAGLDFDGVPDGAVALDLTQSATFRKDSGGWTFDFARLEVTAPVFDWIEDASPNAFQQSLVGSAGVSVLTRIATLAAASSNQSELALSRFWAFNLSLSVDQLPLFLDVVRSAPVIIPFDATASTGSQSLIDLTQMSTASFPPPISCYPNLNNTQRTALEVFESSVFGLPPAQFGSTKVLTASCFPDRPVYGVLNLLHLRTPFLDGRTGFAKQAVVVNEDVKTRVTLHAQELFAGLPGGSLPEGGASTADLDPREHGTILHLNHVVLAFLQAMPSLAFARDFVAFVLSPRPFNSSLPLPLPPSNTSSLASPVLAALPTIEVALHGSILISTVNYTLSSFSTPSSSLFFGTSNSNTFRLWAVQSPKTSSISPSVVWAEGATSERVVVQQTSSDETFEKVFNGALKVVATGVDTTGGEEVREVVRELGEGGLLVL